MRPFGVALLIGGSSVDGTRLFYTEPSGVVLEYKAWSIGRGAEKVKEILEATYDSKMSLEEAKRLAISALVRSVDKIDQNWKARMVVIPTDTKTYTMVPDEEINALIEEVLKSGR